MEYQILFLDIDGTLRAKNTERVSRRVVEALQAVQRTGVKLALATGRARGGIPKRMLRGLEPDYYVCANGCQVEDARGCCLAEDRMRPEEMYALVDWCENYEHPLAFSFDEGYYVYVEYERLRGYYRAATGSDYGLLDGEDQDRHLKGMPYSAFCAMSPQQVQDFTARYGYLGLRFLGYNDDRYDIVREDCDKAVGMRRLLEQLELPAALAVAVGDGSNDVGMLTQAGLGVAMQNGCQAARAAADRICPPAEEDGLVWLCHTLFPAAFGQQDHG